MADLPPPYAEYPRNAPAYGSAAKLQSLMEGYYAYGWLFALHVALSFVVIGGSVALDAREGNLFFVGVAVVMIVMGVVSYRTNAKVGHALGWSKAQIVLASLAIAFGTVCYGIVGYVVLQMIAANHIKRFGVRSGCTGFRKRAVRERIAELAAQESAASPRP